MSAQPEVLDTSIGQYLRQRRRLTTDQINQVLHFQREHGLRFGEAAIALGMASGDDVLWALSQQFQYAYAPEQEQRYDPELAAAADPFGDDAENFRDLRSRLMTELATRDRLARAMAVVSADPGEGKTYFAANIAVTFSQLSGKTLLVDADMRTPRVHKLFGMGEAAGLSSVLSGRCEPQVIQRMRGLPSLYVLPAGPLPPNPLELVHRPAFGLLMRELLTKFDHVVVDTPAASHGADARVISGTCGAALVIARRRTTRMKSAQRLLQDLGKTGTYVTGVMVNEY